MDSYTILALVGVLLCVRQICIFIYRVTYHPLADFPGPKLAGMTFLYEFYQDCCVGIGGQFHFKLEELHEQYGPIVRVTPNEVHVSDPAFFDTLHGGPGSIRDRDPSIGPLVGTKHGTFGTVEHHVHKHRRAAIRPAFSRGSVLTLQPRIRAVSHKLCETMVRRSCNGTMPIDCRVDCRAWSTDFIASLVFKEGDFNLLGDDELAKLWYAKTTRINAVFPYFKQWPWFIPFGTKLLNMTGMLPRASFLRSWKLAREAAKKTQASWQQQSPEKRQNRDPDQLNIYETVLNSNLPPAEKSLERLHHEGFQTFSAGTLTTARAFTMALYHVIADPELHQRLRLELRERIPDGAEIPDLRELESFPLLTAVHRESLRISQAVLARFPMSCPEEDLPYGDWAIPRGYSISMTLSAMGMDRNSFPRPNEFHPERWLQAPEVVERLKRSSVPFGKGSRQCIGLELAQAELYIGIATVFRNLDLQLFGTSRERDIDYKRAGMLGEPSLQTKGIRVFAKRAQ